jgi:FkbM family methyltransferase
LERTIDSAASLGGLFRYALWNISEHEVLMNKNLEVALPNGNVCYLTSAAMRRVAKFLRWETFNRGQYARPGFELRVDDTVIDVGANIGMFALWSEPQIPRGRLVCIEPNPSALECLRININRNELRNVIIVAAAAGSENGTMELISHPGCEALAHSASVEAPWFYTKSRMGRLARWLLRGSSINADQTVAAKSTVVQQMPLSRIMDECGLARVNLLKIDCEGSEYEVLRSLDAAHWARIDRVVIEYHDFGDDRNHRELIEILHDNGFDAEVAHTIMEGLSALVGARVGIIWAKKRDVRSDAQVGRVTGIGAHVEQAA